MKRTITKKQEQALRLCHQDFEGLTQEEAAERMGISRRAITYLLTAVEKVMPQYFPLLTKLEAQLYHYFMVEGWDVDEIAEYIECAPHTIYRALQRAKTKGMFFTSAKKKILSYNSEMDDNHIKQKF